MGILNKYLKPVSNAHSYRKRAKSDFLLFIALLAAIGAIALLLGSCSFSSKVSKAYEVAANTSPITSKDSANGRKIARKFITPSEKPKIAPGKTIRVPYPVLKKDTSYIRQLKDSFENAMMEDANNIAENCLQDVKRNRNEAYRKGLEDGYNKVLKKINFDSFDTKQPDTVFIQDPGDYIDIQDCQSQLRISQSATIKSQTQTEIYKSEASKRLWLLIALASGLLVSIFFHAKRLFKPKMQL